MNKGPLLFGAVTLLVGGGYYAYDQGWFKSKKDDAAAAAEDHHGENKPVITETKMLKIPDLVGVPEADARARWKEAGFSPSTFKVSSKGCNASDENMQPEGTVCVQDRAAGQEIADKLGDIEVVIEHDTFEAGSVGFANEWHRMPDVVGSSLADAQSLLASKGFDADEFEVRQDGTCEPGTVCSTQPAAGKRKSKHAQGILHVDAK